MGVKHNFYPGTEGALERCAGSAIRALAFGVRSIRPLKREDERAPLAYAKQRLIVHRIDCGPRLPTL